MMAMEHLETGWRLSHLLTGLAAVEPTADVYITGLALDSREVQPGDLFLAVPGTRGHGLAHVGEALGRGAAAVAWQPESGLQPTGRLADTPLVVVEGLAQCLGVIADRFFGHPSRAMTVVGITGTDGKTSVSQFIAHALDEPGHRCGVIGTLGYGLYGSLQPGLHTTPDAIRLQAELSTLRAQGAQAVAMEASSHALEQGRVNGTAFDVAVLTNLSWDHLDYHGTEAAYAAAKRKLFHAPGLHSAVLNLDDAFGQSLVRELLDAMTVLGYSISQRATPAQAVIATRIEVTPAGLDIAVGTPWGRGEVSTRLLGRFNAANLLAALAVLLQLDVPLDRALVRLGDVRTVPGRMEPFGGGHKPLVVVDYAHTPAALEHVLVALREHCRGRLWCVFGCGGDRDKGKRPMMGRAAERYADEIILTEDNPRTESPPAIVKDILAGLSDRSAANVVHDRSDAIALAIAQARSGDVVLVAGKGHEQVQIVGNERIPFSDRDYVRARVGEGWR